MIIVITDQNTIGISRFMYMSINILEMNAKPHNSYHCIGGDTAKKRVILPVFIFLSVIFFSAVPTVPIGKKNEGHFFLVVFFSSEYASSLSLYPELPED